MMAPLRALVYSVARFNSLAKLIIIPKQSGETQCARYRCYDTSDRLPADEFGRMLHLTFFIALNN